MLNSWIVTLPAILVLTIAIITHRVLISLVSGIVLACAIITNFNIGDTLSLTFSSILKETQIINLISGSGTYDHLYTFGFLTTLGIIIQLMAHTGGIHAYTHMLARFITHRRTAETTSLLISSSFFLDDYLSNLTTGSIMRSLTDKFKIPRAKLAFLLDSMGAPLCLLIPLSSWMAFILVQLQESGISNNLHESPVILADPFTLYISCIPYQLYTLLIVVSAWLIVRKQLSFGSMRQFEQIAHHTGNLFGGKESVGRVATQETKTFVHGQTSLANFIIPIGSFLIGIPLFALYYAHWHPLQGTIHWYQAIQNSEVILRSLWSASFTSFIITTIFLFIRKSLTISALIKIIHAGALLMLNSLIVLTLAWALSNLLKNDLQTGSYLAQLVIQAVCPAILPITFFATALFATAATGSSWGTISVLLPIGLPMLASLAQQTMHTAIITPAQIPLLLPVLGAIFCGALAGSQISPISDSTVISAASAGCHHLDHVRTQLFYGLPAIIASCIGFILFAFLSTSTLSLTCIIALCCIITIMIILTINKYQNKL